MHPAAVSCVAADYILKAETSNSQGITKTYCLLLPLTTLSISSVVVPGLMAACAKSNTSRPSLHAFRMPCISAGLRLTTEDRRSRSKHCAQSAVVRPTVNQQLSTLLTNLFSYVHVWHGAPVRSMAINGGRRYIQVWDIYCCMHACLEHHNATCVYELTKAYVIEYNNIPDLCCLLSISDAA